MGAKFENKKFVVVSESLGVDDIVSADRRIQYWSDSAIDAAKKAGRMLFQMADKIGLSIPDGTTISIELCEVVELAGALHAENADGEVGLEQTAGRLWQRQERESMFVPVKVRSQPTPAMSKFRDHFTFRRIPLARQGTMRHLSVRFTPQYEYHVCKSTRQDHQAAMAVRTWYGN